MQVRLHSYECQRTSYSTPAWRSKWRKERFAGPRNVLRWPKTLRRCRAPSCGIGTRMVSEPGAMPSCCGGTRIASSGWDESAGLRSAIADHASVPNRCFRNRLRSARHCSNARRRALRLRMGASLNAAARIATIKMRAAVSSSIWPLLCSRSSVVKDATRRSWLDIKRLVST